MWRFLSLTIILWYGGLPSALAIENLHFHGSLVAKPCVIKPGNELIQLHFGTISEKYIYLNQRTHSQPFSIHLTKCNLNRASLVRVSFYRFRKFSITREIKS